MFERAIRIMEASLLVLVDTAQSANQSSRTTCSASRSSRSPMNFGCRSRFSGVVKGFQTDDIGSRRRDDERDRTWHLGRGRGEPAVALAPSAFDSGIEMPLRIDAPLNPRASLAMPQKTSAASLALADPVKHSRGIANLMGVSDRVTFVRCGRGGVDGVLARGGFEAISRQAPHRAREAQLLERDDHQDSGVRLPPVSSELRTSRECMMVLMPALADSELQQRYPRDVA